MKKALIFVLALAVIACIFAFFGVKKQLDTRTLNQAQELVQIPRGSSLMKISEILQQRGILNSGTPLRIFCKLNECNLKAGWYEIPPNSSVEELIALLSSGKSAEKKITIPEGRASWEYPAYLRRQFPEIDSVKWEGLVHNAEFTKELGVDAGSLEGYLLPGTYQVPIDADETAILKLLVAANLKLKGEMEALGTEAWKKLGGWHQVLTLASVVEEETGKPDERPEIAGVFHNRLDLGMPLGADPTVRFIFRNLTGPIYKSQLASNSPYNTRKFKGLMPGPISNPGRAAIEATLHPAETKNLYFVAKDDGSGTHFFSPTLSGHNRYKDQAARNRGE